jgi:hypothetical protein
MCDGSVRSVSLAPNVLYGPSGTQVTSNISWKSGLTPAKKFFGPPQLATNYTFDLSGNPIADQDILQNDWNND